MASKLEKRLARLEKVLYASGGYAAGRAGIAASGRAAGRAALTPAGAAIGGSALYALLRHELNERDREILAQEGASLEDQELYERLQGRMVGGLRVPYSPMISTVGLAHKVAGTKRKVSKANKAVKYGMKLLKGGTKASTGADKGKLPKGAFLTSVKAAGLANPNTPSKIKGKGKLKNLARRIKKWW